MPKRRLTRVVLLFRVYGPDKIHGAPGETRSERGHHYLVALLEFPFVFVETQGYRRGRCVAVVLDVDQCLLLGYLDTSAHGLDDTEVGLVRHEPVDVIYAQVVALHH